MDTLPFGWTVHKGDQEGHESGLLKEGVVDNNTSTHVHDLFHEDAQGFQQASQPWWRIKVFVWEPVLFGTWDGVFTTCMINIFGVVLFLRTGYLVVRSHFVLLSISVPVASPTTRSKHGFIGYSVGLLNSNTKPDYTPGENFFTVFGVFFPAATGVMAGFNMSSDLQRPEHNIPVGTLAAVFTSWFLYLVFAFLLGAICTREALRYDFLIAEKVSLVGFLFLLGLYVSSLASCMGGLYGAPRILQCIAQERVIPALACLGKGVGIAARFSFFTWLKSTLNNICRGKGSPRDEVIVTPSLSGVGLKTRQLTEENADFASRHRYHQSSFIVSNKMVQPPLPR
nr:PREDICTED: solute carrier family 12 member 8-like [Paralichthys olivaceus]